MKGERNEKSSDIILLQTMVIAASILSSDSKKYASRLYVISGSCKHEFVNAQEALLGAVQYTRILEEHSEWGKNSQ